MLFNSSPPTIMHVDINSCFATIEQQANPTLRGRPTVVAAYAEDHGCILAASREAKSIGIGTGMRVWMAKARCPYVTVLSPDPDKYRFVNHQLKSILDQYSSNVSVESIDEMVVDLAGSPQLNTELRMKNQELHPGDNNKTLIHNSLFFTQEVELVMRRIAIEIKRRIKAEIGEWITVSIGIAPNRYLAKIASGLHKPDGLDSITETSLTAILRTMTLEDLCGVKKGNATRLRIAGIYTPVLFATADSKTLEKAFHSIVGRQWWLRLHGYEDGSRYTSFGSGAPFAQGFGGFTSPTGGLQQKSFGHSHALGKPLLPSDPKLWKILSQLVVKMGARLRAAGFVAQGVGVTASYESYSQYWHTQELGKTPLYADADFYIRIHHLLQAAPVAPVGILTVYCYHLSHTLYRQQSLFEQDSKKERLTRAIDSISARFGDFTITPARMLAMNEKVIDRIAFGKV